MKSIIKAVISVLRHDDAYIAENRDYIRDHNNGMLRASLMIYAFILAFYTAFVLVTKETPLLVGMYIVFDAIHIVVCALIFSRAEKSKRNFKKTQIYCALLEISLLAFFAVEGAIPYTDSHSLYVPIAIILIVITFIHSAKYIFTLTFCYTASYAIMSYFAKPYNIFAKDFRIALATFFSAIIGYMILANLRHEERGVVKRLEKLSRIDTLTGLYNKQTIVEQCIGHLETKKDNCALIVFDIDDFKRYNDNYGHDAGDEVLRRFGEVIRNSYGDDSLQGRFGGDEFIVFMYSDSDVAREAEECTNRFIDSIRKLKFSFGGETVACSAGIVISPADSQGNCEETFHSLFGRADKALYTAKNSGKNRYCISESK